MELLILIEPTDGGRFRARAGEPFALTAEGNTREEAVRHLEDLLRGRLQAGIQLAVVHLGSAASPPLARFQPNPLPDDDWAFRTMLEAIDENRRREDETAG